MRFRFHEIEYLSVSKETLHALINGFLKDEILIVIADLGYISLDHIVESHFPIIDAVYKAFIMVHFTLANVCIQNSFVYFTSD